MSVHDLTEGLNKGQAHSWVLLFVTPLSLLMIINCTDFMAYLLLHALSEGLNKGQACSWVLLFVTPLSLLMIINCTDFMAYLLLNLLFTAKHRHLSEEHYQDFRMVPLNSDKSKVDHNFFPLDRKALFCTVVSTV